jgi:hypothetical protein
MRARFGWRMAGLAKESEPNYFHPNFFARKAPDAPAVSHGKSRVG